MPKYGKNSSEFDNPTNINDPTRPAKKKMLQRANSNKIKTQPQPTRAKTRNNDKKVIQNPSKKTVMPGTQNPENEGTPMAEYKQGPTKKRKDPKKSRI
jgi:hypothetical protein